MSGHFGMTLRLSRKPSLPSSRARAPSEAPLYGCPTFAPAYVGHCGRGEAPTKLCLLFLLVAATVCRPTCSNTRILQAEEKLSFVSGHDFRRPIDGGKNIRL